VVIVGWRLWFVEPLGHEVVAWYVVVDVRQFLCWMAVVLST
jgi:hypothetical protein